MRLPSCEIDKIRRFCNYMFSYSKHDKHNCSFIHNFVEVLIILKQIL